MIACHKDQPFTFRKIAFRFKLDELLPEPLLLLVSCSYHLRIQPCEQLFGITERENRIIDKDLNLGDLSPDRKDIPFIELIIGYGVYIANWATVCDLAFSEPPILTFLVSRD